MFTRHAAGLSAYLLLAAALVSLAGMARMLQADEVTPALEAVEQSTDETQAADDPAYPATHEQTAIIEIQDEDGQALALHTFCLNAKGQLLAGVGDTDGEVRFYNADGKLLKSLSVPVKPEALNVGPDGSLYLAGGGELLKYNRKGKLLLRKPSPHAADIKANNAKLREQVIESNKQRATAYVQQANVYEQQIKRFQDEVTKLKGSGDEALSESETQRIKLYEEAIKRYEQVLAQVKNQTQADAAPQLSESQIQEQVARMSEYKMRMASISAAGNDVYIACAASVGYGFDVWRMDEQFENAKKVVSGLRGCCGQMDVQTNADGIYVAENARHRVCHYDRDGKMLNEWGQRDREGVVGFGSCCNPMNLAFGMGGEVYTAESTLGRIKCYSSGGDLMSLVGSVKIVPGCKKVSIAVNRDGSRVYMMDMTRNHIVVMTRKANAPAVAAAEAGAE